MFIVAYSKQSPRESRCIEPQVRLDAAATGSPSPDLVDEVLSQRETLGAQDGEPTHRENYNLSQ